MAKKIRFPLQMNGADVRTIEELREHFSLEAVLAYFTSGKLATWLRDRYYDTEAAAVEELSKDDTKLSLKLCSILNVPFEEMEDHSIDVAFLGRRQEKTALLKQLLNTENLLDRVDAVAFDQDDLLDILDTGTEKMIYLCKGEFEIPLTVTGMTYVGINNPVVLLRAYDNVDFSSVNLKFIDICYGWDVSHVTSADALYKAEDLCRIGKISEAKEILQQLVQTQNPRACYILYKLKGSNTRDAELISNPNDVFARTENKKESSTAIATLERMAEQQDAYAAFLLGKCYDLGINEKQDYTKAVKWYQQACKKGNIHAICNLGVLYENGKGVTQSWEKAAELYRKAAEQGYANAQCNLGWCYENGKGVTQSLENAVEWYRKAAEQGLARGQYCLGWCYEKGKGVAQSLENAAEWYLKAAEQGHVWAQNNLGVCYEYEKGVPQDYAKAAEWYRKAAEQGHAESQFNLGRCYDFGRGMPQDYAKAAEWYRKAAEQGDECAQHNLGNMYLKGQGVTQSYEKAVEWFRKAAEQGFSLSQNNLGLRYENGEGVAKDLTEAVRLYQLAARQDDSTAQNNLKRLGYSW